MAKKRFKNRQEALKYVKDELGLTVGKSKFYQDVKEGKLTIQKDGSVLLRDVEAYGKLHLADRFHKLTNLDDLTRRTKELQNAKLEKQNRELDLKHEREMAKLIPREDVVKVLTAQVITLNASMRQMVFSNAANWITLVGGDHTRLNELIESVNQSLDRQMTAVANTQQFEVVMEA